jgi:hypothetical protein
MPRLRHLLISGDLISTSSEEWREALQHLTCLETLKLGSMTEGIVRWDQLSATYQSVLRLPRVLTQGTLHCRLQL